MKRSVSTIADQRVNGLWEEEEKSPERFYRPRHKSYKAAGWCCFCYYHSVLFTGNKLVSISPSKTISLLSSKNVLPDMMLYRTCNVV